MSGTVIELSAMLVAKITLFGWKSMEKSTHAHKHTHTPSSCPAQASGRLCSGLLLIWRSGGEGQSVWRGGGGGGGWSHIISTHRAKLIITLCCWTYSPPPPPPKKRKTHTTLAPCTLQASFHPFHVSQAVQEETLTQSLVSSHLHKN